MGARDLIADLSAAGMSVTAEGGSLVVRPASQLNDDLRAIIRAAKPDLLALLAPDPRTLARRARLIHWGWPAGEAEAMAERLSRRDAESDDRVSCAGDCGHYRPGRCGNHRRAGLHAPELARDLAALLQRCPGFRLSR